MNKSYIILLLTAFIATYAYSQQAYFVDGYHGGIYGHYPVKWKTQFIVDQLSMHPDWRIGLEIESETWDTVQVRTPEAYRQFKKVAASEQIEFTNPTYAQPYCYNISGESIIRQFQYGIKKIKKHFPDVSFVTYSVEEPCFTSCLPQILKLFGFKYAVLKCPNTCWGGYTNAYGGELVNWIGTDGTSILTVPRYACEKLEKGSTWQTTAWCNSESYLIACREARIEHPVGMCYQDAGWKNGPWLGDGKNIKNNSIYIRWKDYIETISAGETTDNWHFSQEDMRINLMWGSQILQKIAQQVRVSENKIVMAEKISLMAHLENGHRSNQTDVDEAWRTLMLAQHHDSWIVPYNRLNGQATWAEKIEQWTDRTNNIADEVIKESMQSFCHQDVTVRDGCLRVFNTLGTKRQTTMNVLLPNEYSDADVKMYDWKGKEIACLVEKEGEKSRLFFEVKVPPFGYSTYGIKKRELGENEVLGSKVTSEGKRVAKQEYVVENDQYKIVFDLSKGGTIKSLIAKKEGNKEFAEQIGEYAWGELRGFFYEEGKFRSSTEHPAQLTVLRDNIYEKKLKIEGKIASHPFTQIITLSRGAERIDFELTIDWKKNVGIGEYKEKHWRDNRRAYCDDRFKLSVLFPVDLRSPRIYKNAPFDVCESKLNDTFFGSWDQIKHNVILHWVDLAEQKGDYSLALLSDHTTSYSHGENSPLGLTAQYSGVGLWGPDYKITGPLKMKYALIPHRGKWDEASIATASDCWNEPLVSAWHSSGEPDSKSFIDLHDAGYQISSAQQQDGKIMLRLFNAEGNAKKHKVTFHLPLSGIEEVDLNGRCLEKKEINTYAGKSEITISMPRFGMKTFRLSLAERELIPTDYVNPLIGASSSVGAAGVYHGLGKTFPGATTPYGMVQVNPNTITGGDNSSGYSDEHKTMEGFAFTQMSGVGWFGDLGNFLVMPTTGKLHKVAGKENNDSIKGYRSAYNKATETAKAGYYSVELTDYGIKAESSATPHCGILRFTYPASNQSRIQIDLARRVGGTSTSQYIKVKDDYTIQGWMKCTPDGGGWGNGEGEADYTVYYYAQFSKPLTNYGFWSADIPDRGVRKRDEVVSIPYLTRISEAPLIKDQKELEGKHLGFFTEFPTKEGETVEMKVGISFVDMEGAAANFKKEIVAKDFEQVKQEADERWNKELSRVQISGGTDDEKTIFYTALYHTMIDPRIYTDVDGRYVGGDQKVYTSDSTFTKRTIFSGWDVFRSQFPLQTIINPRLVSDELNSLITMAEQSGREYYERWELLNSYTGCMLGNPALSVLADAYIKGIRTYDVEKAYRYAVNTSRHFGNDSLGYTPEPLSISHTLEYAYTDWCISQLAKTLGKEEDFACFYEKGQAYHRIFDKEKGWFRPRKADGSWEAWPENARTKEWYGCIEANAYQQGWFVPHDVPGMVELMGGKDKTIADLTAFFTKTPSDMLWNQYYNHANEPVHFVPFLFNQLGVPWHTQKWTRYICEKAYANKVEGIVGNEDVGQMSAWYILAASGIHPSCPGNTRMEITSPVFNQIRFRLDPDYYSGNIFTIMAYDNTAKNIYIQKALLNGKEYHKCYLDFADIADGGTLELFMGDKPNAEWGVVRENSMKN